MSEEKRRYNDMKETRCSVCGKTFCMLDPASWVYQKPGKHGTIWFCSWKCLRSVPEKKRGRVSGKRDQIFALIEQGKRNYEIVKEVGCSERLVRYWKERYWRRDEDA